jgi:hypothetical protein
MNSFECLSYMSYMYMRKHRKEDNSVKGSNSGWKDTFAIDDKGGRDSSDAEDKGMVPGGEMVTEMQMTKACFQGEHE